MRILILCTLLFCLFAFSAIAEENVELTEEEEDKAEDRAYVVAKHLTFKIDEAIAKSERIISYISEKGEDTSGLETLVSDLETLKNDIDPDTLTKEEVEEIVSQGRIIVQEFRELARSLIPEEERDQVRERAKIYAEEREDIKREKMRMKALREKHNAKQIERVEMRLQARLGETSVEQRTKFDAFKKRVQNADLSDEQKEELRNELRVQVRDTHQKNKEVIRKHRDQARAEIDENKDRLEQRANARIQAAERQANVQENRVDQQENRQNARIERHQDARADRVDARHNTKVDRRANAANSIADTGDSDE